MRMLKVIVRNKYIDPFSNLDGKCERKNNLFRLTGDGKMTEWKESNLVCNHTSDLQNRESDLLMTSMITDRTELHDVLLPITITVTTSELWK